MISSTEVFRLGEKKVHACLPTNQVYVSKKHSGADVVTICMLLLKQDVSRNRCGHGFNSHPGNPGVAQLVRAQHKHGFDSRSQTDGVAQWLEHYTYNVG